MISEKKQVTWLHGNRQLSFCLIKFGSVCGFCSWIPWERLHSLFHLLNNMRKLHRFFSWNSSIERMLTHQPVFRMVAWSSSVRPSKNKMKLRQFVIFITSAAVRQLRKFEFYWRIHENKQNTFWIQFLIWRDLKSWKMTQIISHIVCVVSFVICCSL